MALIEGASWQDQLAKLRPKVVDAEKSRDLEKKQKLERSKEALAGSLQRDTPEELARQLRDIEGAYSTAIRAFYPPPHFGGLMERIEEYEVKVHYYIDQRKRFSDVFAPAYKQVLPKCDRDMAELKKGMAKQKGQWEAVQQIVEAGPFRAKAKEDDLRLIDIAKEFHHQAHGIQLNIPKTFFATKRANFFVADRDGEPFVYVEYYPNEATLSFAIYPLEKVNFTKLARGVLHQFCLNGPLETPIGTVQVRLTNTQEVKFYTDMGFLRSKTLGMSDWLYQRRID